MYKLLSIIFCALIACSNLHAQEFVIDVPKQSSNAFARDFVKLLNEAPNYFKEIADKSVDKGDSAYVKVAIRKSKIRLKGATSALIVMDSIPFAEYFFGRFHSAEEADAAYINLTNSIAEALNRKVLFKTEEGKATSMVKQTKIAYALNSGFFLHNIVVQLNRNFIDSSYHLFLKIRGGKPPFFYKIMRNEPTNSFMFVGAFRSQLNSFQRQAYQGCLGSLLPFNCTKARRTKDSAYVIYTKLGFQDLPDARKEFEIALTNIRVCMGDDYVYYLPSPEKNHLRKVAFLKFEDIEKKNPKTVTLTLVEYEKEDYRLELSFNYK